MNESTEQLNLFPQKNNQTPKSEKLINEFNRIKSLGYIPDNRPNNKDGGIGNTFEDHLGVEENNLKDSDYEGYEVKTQRSMSKAMISMFSKSPSFPKKANSYLKDTYGEIRDPKFPLKKLYASIYGHRTSLVYGSCNMKLEVDYKENKVFLIITDLENNILENNIYWTFDDLRKASKKMKNLIVVSAESKKIGDIRHYHYKNAKIYNDFNFDSFLEAIQNGSIQFDLRMGVYGSGKNYGKPHDHGSGFRIKRENFHQLFNENIAI